jgi:signal transduction histidine kinase
LEADTTGGNLNVRGDATAIRQIIYNLVSNALKFTPADGYVHVATGLLPDGSPYFVVRDTGEGMSEDEIVAAFYAETTGPRRGGGYGIGLPMVRRLAEMMKATVDVDSTPGKGTVVLVSFPFES